MRLRYYVIQVLKKLLRLQLYLSAPEVSLVERLQEGLVENNILLLT